MAKTPNQVGAKWASNLGKAQDAIRAGINAVDRSPGELAAAKQLEYVQGVQDNATKWAERVSNVSLADWKKATLDVGLQRLTSGISKGTPKMERFMAQWLPYMEGLKSRLQSIPKGGIEASIARAAEAIRYNKAFRNR